jgi:small-conductance mechanosensitive channel
MQFETISVYWYALLAALARIPEPIIAILILTIAVCIALIVHRILMTIADRTLEERHSFANSMLTQMQGPLRLALVLLALNFAARMAPFDPQVGQTIAAGLQLAFILLAGWMALTCTNIMAQLYLRRFDITAPDNLLARKHTTQVRVLKGAVNGLILILTVGAALMTFEAVRQYGIGLFTSAGIAGVVVGLAARPVLSNLLAGVQLAMTQPIRLDDVVVVENEWGRIEDITATYVVIKIWDWRRLIVPLSYFIEKPFQNWTRQTAAVIGTVFLYVDYSVPVDAVRAKLADIVRQSDLWDGDVANVQITDTKEHTVELRALVGARNAGDAWDLRCLVREKLIAFLQTEYPQALPRTRADVEVNAPAAGQNLERLARAAR